MEELQCHAENTTSTLWSRVSRSTVVAAAETIWDQATSYGGCSTVSRHSLCCQVATSLVGSKLQQRGHGTATRGGGPNRQLIRDFAHLYIAGPDATWCSAAW
mmetsp:Transcript_46129/g.100200  ORF Transcript_46129/g.100200 Transcript_46129/m.100200 type:complete len:102 (-) Transcript_46129:1760-2065(-)